MSRDRGKKDLPAKSKPLRQSPIPLSVLEGLLNVAICQAYYSERMQSLQVDSIRRVSFPDIAVMYPHHPFSMARRRLPTHAHKRRPGGHTYRSSIKSRIQPLLHMSDPADPGCSRDCNVIKQLMSPAGPLAISPILTRPILN
jgi:hypothetical protein